MQDHLPGNFKVTGLKNTLPGLPHDFIAAEIVNYGDLVEAGSLQAAKAAGKVRTEGKTYVMKPDDVVEFRFNV